jgi:hypothetical protein
MHFGEKENRGAEYLARTTTRAQLMKYAAQRGGSGIHGCPVSLAVTACSSSDVLLNQEQEIEDGESVKQHRLQHDAPGNSES